MPIYTTGDNPLVTNETIDNGTYAVVDSQFLADALNASAGYNFAFAEVLAGNVDVTVTDNEGNALTAPLSFSLFITQVADGSDIDAANNAMGNGAGDVTGIQGMALAVTDAAGVLRMSISTSSTAYRVACVCPVTGQVTVSDSYTSV